MPKQIRDRSNSPRQTAPAISALLLLLLFSRIESVSAQSPSFVTQPGDQLVRRGETVTLTASAAGTPPLSFQWKFNGADLALATNSTLVLTNVSPAQDGRYLVQVANSLGSITSAEAKVTVCWDVVLSSVEETKATVDFSGGLLRYAHVAVNDRGEVFTIPEWDTSSRNQEFIVVKSDPSGAEVWRHTVTSTMFPDGVRSAIVVAGNDGTVLAVATLSVGTFGNAGLVLAKYDSSGNRLWITEQTFKTQGEMLAGVGVLVDGSIYIITSALDVSFRFNAARKFSSTGELLWEIFRGDTFAPVLSVLDAAGNLYFAQADRVGTAYLGPPLFYSASVWKYDSEGTLVWSRSGSTQTGDKEVTSTRVAIDADGNIALELFHNGVPAFTTFHFEQNPIPGWPVVVFMPTYVFPIYAGATSTVIAGLDVRGAPPLHFQWRFNGADILGATNSGLTISNAQTNNTGNYTLLVTNLVGCTLSPPIYRQVIGPAMSAFDRPRIVREVLPGNNGSLITNTYFDVIVHTAAGWNYAVQSSSSLSNLRDWEESKVINVSNSTETPMRFLLEDSRFFRIVWQHR